MFRGLRRFSCRTGTLSTNLPEYQHLILLYMLTDFVFDYLVMLALPLDLTLMVEVVRDGKRMAMAEVEYIGRSFGAIGRPTTRGRVAVACRLFPTSTIAQVDAQCFVCSKDGCPCLTPALEKGP